MLTLESNTQSSFGSIASETEYYPYVRFGKDTESGVSQNIYLRSIHDPIPDDVQYASGIYLCTKDEKDRIEWFKKEGIPRTTNGDLVAKDIQDSCEKDNRVLYPIHFEADEGGSDTQKEWIRNFIQKHLPVSEYDCHPYHSGNRSVHAHIPLFIGEAGLDKLKNMVQSHEGELDASIYQRKNQFRLPGVEHSKTGLPKTPIQWEWSNEQIVHEMMSGDPEKPETYADIVGDWETWTPFKAEPKPWEPGQPEPDEDSWHYHQWELYNSHPFFPYAKTGNGQRSLVTGQIMGKPYGKDGETYLPMNIKVAFGADGEFTMKNRFCPVKLSKTDYRKVEKMNLDEYQTLTIIGGKSGSSRIFKTSIETSQEIANADSVTEAIEILENEGFDTGASRRVDPIESGETESEPTEAKRLQMKAERNGIDSISHDDMLRVANRLLKIDSQEEAHSWFKKMLGDRYERKATEEKFAAITKKFDDL